VKACFRILFTSFCAVFLLGACTEQAVQTSPTSQATSISTLTFYNWEEYIGSETIAEFERETGIKVDLILFEDDEEIIGAMQSGSFDGDLVVVSESLSREMVGARLLQEIDYSMIPNARHIDPQLMNMDVVRPYAVPYLMGTTGFIVNTRLFPGETRSWGALWDERARGRIGMLNNPFEVAAVASKLLGYGVNPDNEQFPLVRAKLLEQKPLVAGYFGPMEVVDKMVSGELLISQVYSGDALMAMERNPDLEYVVPVEGCVSWMDDFVIPKSARNSIEAHRFIDFIHRPEIIGRIASEVWYATPNLAATPFIDSEVLQSKAVFPPAEVQAKCQHFGDMGGGDEVRGRLEVWAELTSD
jgi:spermidine/putrescine-binding protein